VKKKCSKEPEGIKATVVGVRCVRYARGGRRARTRAATNSKAKTVYRQKAARKSSNAGGQQRCE